MTLVKGLALKPKSRLTIIMGDRNKKFGVELKKEATRMGASVDLIIAENGGKNWAQVKSFLTDSIRKTDALIYGLDSGFIVNDRLGIDLRSAGEAPMKEAREAYKRRKDDVAVLTIGGIGSKFVRRLARHDFAKARRLISKIYSKVNGAKKITITSPSGTNLVVEMGNHKWIKGDGIIRKKSASRNIPFGEVFATPASVNGKLVIDISMNPDYFPEQAKRKIFGIKINSINPVFLKKTPVSVEIREGKVVPGSIECKNPEIKKELEKHLFSESKSPNVNNLVGEIGIGANPDIRAPVGEFIFDEKIIGTIHVAFGQGFSASGGNWQSSVHIDSLVSKPTIHVDGKMIMGNGKFARGIIS